MNKDALEAGVPHRRVRNRSEGPRSSRSPVSSLEGPAAQRASTLSGILERRRAAERQMADVFSALPEPAERIPARVTGELGFILHAWDWSETSLLLDVLTVRYGRVFLVARGAPPAPSQYRGLLTAFCPLRFSWTGSKEAKMLVRAEWQGTMVPLTGEALLSGFYVNELILKLTVREERHPGLFEAYVKAIHALALDERDAMQPASRIRDGGPQGRRLGARLLRRRPLALVLRQGRRPRGARRRRRVARGRARLAGGPRARNAFGRADESCGASRLA